MAMAESNPETHTALSTRTPLHQTSPKAIVPPAAPRGPAPYPAPQLNAIHHPAVASKFASYPPAVRRKLLLLRKLILETAAATDGVGRLEETLKWGEPAYVTRETGMGSTVRIDWKNATPNQYAIYFNCNTNLVETFRSLFPHDFRFEGHRALIFDVSDVVPTEALEFCIAAALTYHHTKRQNARGKRPNGNA